jgi:molybdopterin-guanine dinucleotide biosynthesis protein A
MRLGALVLTGGASSRMGVDKAELDWLGARAIDRVMAVAKALGAAPVYGVGAHGYGWPHVTEEPAMRGPVGGILAGAAVLLAEECERALVLAVDAPSLRPDDVHPLLVIAGPGAAYAGLPLPMVFNLSALPRGAQADWPVARLAEAAGLEHPDCPPEARARIRGANTPAEREALLRSLRETRQTP